ncbi:hypothetical protein P4534_13370 [Peribacillus butanolivorans]|nr:hypothetical protein [Peribacillus butanolivorans]MED3689796.1 hypothetical protein [Peribacillus butanolivorans]
MKKEKADYLEVYWLLNRVEKLHEELQQDINTSPSGVLIKRL